ncbi:MAG: hypothetical protein SWH78_03215 [Thermodesulfobacteriota bacterium]|nr:hypothetical protein [Thermodesulfobacteriota bacterium]
METTSYGAVNPGVQKTELPGVNNMIPEKRKPPPVDREEPVD